MRSEERLAEAIERSAGAVDADAVFARIAKRKSRRAVARKARVPATLATAVAVVVGAIALSSPGEPAFVAADRDRGKSQVTENAGAAEPAPSDESPAAAPESQAAPAPASNRAPTPPRDRQATPQTGGESPGLSNHVAAGRVDSAPSGPTGVNDVDFVDPQHGWALRGMNGEIHATSDGGRTWTLQGSNLGSDLRALDFVDPLRGWVATNYDVLHTADGGKTWTKQAVPPRTGPEAGFSMFNDLTFVDSDHGWVVGNCGFVLATHDGGVTWETHVPADCGRPALTRVFFMDNQKGWAVQVTGAALVATTDGGKTWASQPIGDTSLYDVFFADADRGWAVGSGGTILATSDGGRSWARQVAPFNANLIGVFFADSATGWAVGAHGENNERGAVFATTDGGQTWVAQVAETRSLTGGVAFTPSVAWVYGVDGLLHTTDGGATWRA